MRTVTDGLRRKTVGLLAGRKDGQVDRSEAVNLALFIKLDKQNTRIADKGVMLLADAVIAMDAVLKGEQA